MCGIAGLCNLNGSDGVSLETIKNMTGVLRHRGPDESGVYIDDHVGLGHARLSIIDLSSGVQPIHNEDKSMWIVYNWTWLPMKSAVKFRTCCRMQFGFGCVPMCLLAAI